MISLNISKTTMGYIEGHKEKLSLGVLNFVLETSSVDVPPMGAFVYFFDF